MFRWIMALLIVSGIGLASCGVGIGRDLAVDCRLGLNRDLPAQSADGFLQPGLARMVFDVLLSARPGLWLMPSAARLAADPGKWLYRVARRPAAPAL